MQAGHVWLFSFTSPLPLISKPPLRLPISSWWPSASVCARANLHPSTVFPSLSVCHCVCLWRVQLWRGELLLRHVVSPSPSHNRANHAKARMVSQYVVGRAGCLKRCIIDACRWGKRCITDAPRWGCVTSNHVVPRGTGVRLLLRCGGKWSEAS